MPFIIQGGMGIGVSGWQLARAVSHRGQLGVVSGVGLDVVLTRRLQDGDRGGHLQYALARFPAREAVAAVLRRYFLPEGRAAGRPYRDPPMYGRSVPAERELLTVMAEFAAVF